MERDKKNLEKNISKIYILRFFGMFLLIMPVIVPFFQSLGVDMKGVYLLQSIFAITVFILEVPSGYICDLLGRKKSIIVAFFLKGVGFTLLGLSKDISQLIAAEIILAFAISLQSGTDVSLIYDTMAITRPGKAPIKVLGKSVFYGSLGEGFAALLASILMIFSASIINLAIVSAVLSWIPLIIAFTLVEPPREKMGSKHKENFKYIFNGLFKQTRLLNLIILNMMFYSTATLFAVWIFQKYWQNLGVPILYFGFLWAIINFIVSFTSKSAHKIEKRWGSTKILLLIGLLPIGGYFGISLIDHYMGFFACLLFQFCRGFGGVVFRDALNKRVTADFRATANSITQMGTRILFAIFGPLYGHLIDKKGLSFSTGMMGWIMIMIFFLILAPLLRERKNFMTIK